MTDYAALAVGFGVGFIAAWLCAMLRGDAEYTRLHDRLLRERAAHSRTQTRLAGAQSRLAAAIDAQRDADAAASFLRGEVQRLSDKLAAAVTQIGRRDAELADAQAKIVQANDAIGRLLQALNSANVRCAERQQALQREGITVESAYFLAALSDGTIAGPFSRN